MHEAKVYTFNGVLETVKLSQWTTAVFLPHHTIIDLPKGRLRVSGIINGAPFSLAIQFRKDGSRFFTVGEALRRSARIGPGDKVSVAFRILSQTSLELPNILETVTLMEEARKLNRSLKSTTGLLLSDFLSSLKSLDSRIRKSFEIVQRARTVETPAPKKKKTKRQGKRTR